MPDQPPAPLTLDLADVPPQGALGLLAYGYRGLEAWRTARGTGWVDDRKREWEAYEIRVAAAKAARTDAAATSGDGEASEPA